MPTDRECSAMFQVALAEVHQGLAEGGMPIGAALFARHGRLIGRGHDRVTTPVPCWYGSGLIRQFRSGTGVVGASVNDTGDVAWLRNHGVAVHDCRDPVCIARLAAYLAAHPALWNEDMSAV